MAIRLRVTEINGRRTLVALCAARSVEKPGDVYLDDGQHYALAEKFWMDYPELRIKPDADTIAAVEREESNNANRVEWEKVYGDRATDLPASPSSSAVDEPLTPSSHVR